MIIESVFQSLIEALIIRRFSVGQSISVGAVLRRSRISGRNRLSRGDKTSWPLRQKKIPISRRLSTEKG